MERDEELLEEGNACLAAGDLAGAEAALRQVGVASPLCREALLALSRVMVAARQLAEAQRCAEEADNLDRDAHSCYQLGAVQLAANKPARAQVHFEDALDRAPDLVDAHVMLGHVHKELGRVPAAIRSYEEALRHDDANAGARYYLAETLLETGDVMRARTQLHYLLQLRPDYGPAVVLVGDIAFHHRDFRQAVVEYVRGYELGAADADVLERLGRAYEAIADPYQALKAYDRVLAAEKTRWDTYVAAATLCERQAWFNRARRYHEALSFVPTHRNEAYKGLARVEAGIEQSGLEGIDPAGSPEDDYDYTHGPFRVPEVLGEDAEPGKGHGAPLPGPLIGRAGHVGGDAFGVGAEAAGYLADFVNTPKPAARPKPPPSPKRPPGGMLENLQEKLRNKLRDQNTP
jgi:tetratricopeptide (TPR) repeat protein